MVIFRAKNTLLRKEHGMGAFMQKVLGRFSASLNYPKVWQAVPN